MRYNLKKGFTLIELLVVIAIIGVLSAVVLASLNTARSKGNDAAVMSDLGGIRTQAQIFYGDNANSYTGVCAESTIAKQITGAEIANGAANTVVCNASATAYAVSSGLITPSPAAYYCVDSVGTATTTATALVTGGATVCS